MLRDNNILSVPVIDSENDQFSGVFSVTDLMKAMVKGVLSAAHRARMSWSTRDPGVAHGYQLARA